MRESYWIYDRDPAAAYAYYSDTTKHAPYAGGPQYHGRGYLQITHINGYRTYGDRLGIDLVSDPDRAMEPGIAAQIFALYWADRNIASMADGEDWKRVRQAVVGYVTNPPGLDRLVTICGALLN